MRLNIKVTGKEISQIKNDSLKEFKNIRLQVLPNISITSSSIGNNLLINLRNDVYGELYIDNSYHGNDTHSPILYAARWSSMFGLHATDQVSHIDILSKEELSNLSLIHI